MTMILSFSAASPPLPVHSPIPRCTVRLLQRLHPWYLCPCQSLVTQFFPGAGGF